MLTIRPARMVCPVLLLLAALLLAVVGARAQRYPFYNVSIEHGLIQSQVQCMTQDKAGHLWVGTLGGLSRYDGHAFNTYSVRDGLPDNSVQALDADSSGKIWIGTKKGLATYDGRQFRQYIFQSSENPQGNIVQAIKNGAAGTTWCIAGRNIYSIHNNKIKSLQLPNGFKEILSIELDATGRLTASFPGSSFLYLYSDRGWDSIAVLPAPYGSCYISKLQKDSRKRTWLVTNYGLYIYQNGSVRKAFPDLKVNAGPGYITCLTEARDRSIWLGTGNGAFRVTDSNIKHYRKANGFTDNRINDILTDAEGNIWMGSDGQGLFRFSGAPFIAIDESTRLPSAQIMALEADPKSKGLFMGSYDAGLYYYKNNEISQVHFPGNITPTIVAMATRYQSELWIGTPSGLWCYNKTFKRYSIAEGLPSSFITALYVTKDNRLWIGFGAGAAVYDGTQFTSLPLQDVTVYDFLPLGKDSMLLATGSGIKLFYDDEIRSFITGTTIDSATPQCLTLQGNQLWAGSSDNGIISYDLRSGKSMVINKSNGLRSDFIYNIYGAQDGSIWAGTGFGIYNIKPGNKLIVNFYGRGQGVTGMESNHNAILGMPDGTIWFGTTDGAMQYRPGTQRTTPYPVSIVMQSVKLFGERITDSSYYKGTTPFYNVPLDLRLPPTKNNLTFTFQALSLSDESGISYRYHMEGLDAQWSDWAPINTITYSALPPGTYALHVQCSAEGQLIDRELVYSFVIITPFHKTILFRFLIFGGCILLGVSLQYMANRRKQARLKMIEALRREEQAKVRERTAEDFHDEVGNKLTRINVLTNVLKTKLGDTGPDTRRIIDQINDNTLQLYSGTRDILWSLIPSNDNLYEILHRIRDFGGDLFGDTEVAFHFTGTEEHWREYRLPMDASRNLIMIFKEAMNNCLKYAEAGSVTLAVNLDNSSQVLTLQLTDDGKGFDVTTVKRGNGLNNMEIRAKRINGLLAMHATPGKGTILTLQFKIPQNRG